MKIEVPIISFMHFLNNDNKNKKDMIKPKLNHHKQHAHAMEGVKLRT